jgi:hypothetical protein
MTVAGSRWNPGGTMPITLTCSGCGRSFHLKDEMAGRKVRCPGCEAVQVVPDLEPDEDLFTLDTEDDGDGGLHPSFRRDRFLFRQKLMAISEKYVVWDDEERPILFIERPAHAGRQVLSMCATMAVFIATFALALVVWLGLSERVEPKWIGGVAFAVLLVVCLGSTVLVLILLQPRRHIYFYADESRETLLLQVLQDSNFQLVVATYTVLDPDGQCLGRMAKNYLHDFFRKRWDVRDAEGGRLLLVAREDSLLLSLLRRVLGPSFGFLRTNFILAVPEPDGVEVTRGEFNRNFTIFDRYVLDLSRDRPRMIDRRLAVALGVLLDTGEHR